MPPAAVAPLAFGVLVGVGGCSSAAGKASSVSFGNNSNPPPQDIQAFSRLTNTIPTEVTVGSSTGWTIVDTGNPWVLLDPTAFPTAASLPANGGPIASVTAGSETVNGPYAFGSASGDLTADATFTLDGNLGCTVICGFVAAFNYRDVTFGLAATAPSPPSGVGAATL